MLRLAALLAASQRGTASPKKALKSPQTLAIYAARAAEGLKPDVTASPGQRMCNVTGVSAKAARGIGATKRHRKNKPLEGDYLRVALVRPTRCPGTAEAGAWTQELDDFSAVRGL